MFIVLTIGFFGPGNTQQWRHSICSLISCFLASKPCSFSPCFLHLNPEFVWITKWNRQQHAKWKVLSVGFWLWAHVVFYLFPWVTVLGSHNERMPLCLFTSFSSLSVTLAGDESPAQKDTEFISLSRIFPSWVCLILTSLVFQRWRSLGREEHLGRHSSSFLGR